jgi:hypothetical protein
MFAYANAHNRTALQIHFIYLGNKEFTAFLSHAA